MPSNLQKGISSVISSVGGAVAVGKHIQNQQKIAEKEAKAEEQSTLLFDTEMARKKAQTELAKTQLARLQAKTDLEERLGALKVQKAKQEMHLNKLSYNEMQKASAQKREVMKSQIALQKARIKKMKGGKK